MTEYIPLPGTPLEELDTPCIVIDLDVAESNIAKLQAAANQMGVDVRPHSKTNKSPYWVRKQLDAGAIGVCCAKVGEAEVKAHFQSPVAARGKNSEAALACSFDTPTGKDESGSGNHGTVSRVEVGKGKEGNALWFRKVKKKPGGNAIAKGSYVQPHWNMSVPMFAQAMALADDTLLVAGPPDVMDEEYSFERIMAGDESINATLEAQREALEGKRGGVLWAVSTGDGKQEEEIKLDALPVWDGMAVANGSLYVATKDGKVTRFGRGK